MDKCKAIVSRMVSVFDRVIENADPADWRNHFFGLSKERWTRLAGQSFLITGAGTGYGRCIAGALAAAGAKVFITGRRSEMLEGSVDEAGRVFGTTKYSFVLLQADLTNTDEVKSLFLRLRNLSPSLHGLVSCAAVSGNHQSGYPLQDGDDKLWDVIMNTNVKAQWLLARSALPHMYSLNSVKMVFLTSGAGWADTSGFGMYNVSKAALNSLVCSLATESTSRYPDADTQINVVDPGEARTEMNQGSMVSPYSVVSIILSLLSHPEHGPNGKFFRRNGKRVQFCSAGPYLKRL